MSPHLLQHHNIPVLRVTQYPGEFVINYAGKDDLEQLFFARKTPLAFHEQLICHVVITGPGSAQVPIILGSTTGTTVLSPQTLLLEAGSRSG